MRGLHTGFAVISRANALAAMHRDTFDVVVIGGGITGAGVALDAATRGYSVALVERDDFSCGTSSRSSKMVHGGLRYLQNFDLGLVREALLERQLMVRLAPHLVKPLPFLVPALEGARRDYRIGVGLNMYDVMSMRNPRARRRARREAETEGGEYWSPDRHRTIDAAEVVSMIPPLEARDPSSAYLFYDCQTDDSRLVLTVLGEAERFGAICVNGAEAVELIEEDGKAAGVVCRGGRVGGALPDLGRERRQRHRRVGGPHPSRGAARRGGRAGAGDPAEPRHPHPDRPRAPADERGRGAPGR